LSQEQDQYLIQALLSGDSEAWDEISSCVEKWLKNASRRHYIPDEDLDDIKQDILTKLIENNYRKLQGFSFRCRLSSWVGSIVNNHLYDHYRSEIRRERRNSGFGEFKKEISIEVGDDIELLSMIDDMERVEKAIESLMPVERRVVRMTYWDNLNLTEISRITGERVSTVTSRLSRARLKLRETLAPSKGDESQKAI
jgi:RNA polymerase sigma-70 factor (ECF subfamily)